MRNLSMALAGVLMLTTGVAAQQPAAPKIDPQNNRLDALLLQWEQAMKNVQTLSAQCVRTTVDKTFDRTDVFEGVAEYMRPNFAHLRMAKKGKAELFEEYLCTGTFLYEFVPSQKLIRIHNLPPAKDGQVADDSFLGFLFGMKAVEAKRRYDIKLLKEDQWYVYLNIEPRFPADKADFKLARLVLTKSTFLPRELYFVQQNENTVKWDLPKVVSGAGVTRQTFAPPNPPQAWNGRDLTGWRLEQAPRVNNNPQPRQPAPRVVRPNQGR